MKWAPDLYWKKAKLYSDKANRQPHDSADFPLHCALALEFLSRAAITKINPALNADPRDDLSMLYASGVIATQTPRSLPLHSVFLRLEKAISDFGKVQRELCDYLTLLRNDELHSGGFGFADLKESSWLPRYYEVCKVLCAHLGKTLADLVGAEVAKAADSMIATLNAGILKAVKDRISAHATQFNARPKEEQERVRADAQLRLKFLPNGKTRHRCPACASEGIITGDLIVEQEPVYEDEQLVMSQEFLASSFKCPACDLELRNPDEVASAQIEPRFVGKRTTDLHELFQPEDEDPYMNM